jgi:BirA family biotin operon repressor/biotin-[acetyl-CoA-carboxylase] ligase
MIGNKVIKFNTIDSTNTFIKNNFNQLSHGDIVRALEQTKGRGRHGNSWISQAGNLYFSVLLKEEYSRYDLFQVIMKTSITIITLLESYNIQSKIKYPNDILVNNKKISGILLESVGYNDLDFVVVGVGININQTEFPEITNPVTSLSLNTGKKYDVDLVLQKFIDIYNSLSEQDFIYKKYLRFSGVIGKEIKFKDREYRITNIDKRGNIVLENELTTKVVSFDEISLNELYYQQ